jgi:glutaredoxin-like YruB-family protein
MTTQKQKVEIYSTPNCGYCAMAKEYFKKNNIVFQEYDVATDVKRRQEMLDRTHQFGVPVIIIDNQIILGFDKAKVSQLLGI